MRLGVVGICVWVLAPTLVLGAQAPQEQRSAGNRRFEVIAAIIEDELDLGVRFWNFQAETYKLGKL